MQDETGGDWSLTLMMKSASRKQRKDQKVAGVFGNHLYSQG